MYIDPNFKPKGLQLHLEVDGATPDDIKRGLDAAKAYLGQSSANPFAAYSACDARDHSQDDDELSTEAHFLADFWAIAGKVALDAACANMPYGPKSYVSCLLVG